MTAEEKDRFAMIIDKKTPAGYIKTLWGTVPSTWSNERIDKLCTISSGSTPQRKNPDNFKGNILWVTSGELKAKQINDTLEKITKSAADASNLIVYDPGTVLIAIYGLEAAGVRGTASIAGKKCTISQACMAFSDFHKIFNEYFYYWYLANGEIIGRRYAQGTKQQNLSAEIVGAFPIYFPDKREQKKIIEILTLQDRYIELKERLAKEKKYQKKYLIQKLFSDGVSSKAICGKNTKVKIGNLLIEKNERNKKNKRNVVSNILSINNSFGFISQSEQFGKTVASEDTANYKVVSYKDIAYNPSRINVGSIALYMEQGKGIVSPMYTVITTTPRLLPEYFIYFTKTTDFEREMKRVLSGSVRQSLGFSDLCQFNIDLPPVNEQEKIVKIISTIEKEILLMQESIKLEKQKKKALMQLLLTGIVRVKP